MTNEMRKHKHINWTCDHKYITSLSPFCHFYHTVHLRLGLNCDSPVCGSATLRKSHLTESVNIGFLQLHCKCSKAGRQSVYCLLCSKPSSNYHHIIVPGTIDENSDSTPIRSRATWASNLFRLRSKSLLYKLKACLWRTLCLLVFQLCIFQVLCIF